MAKLSEKQLEIISQTAAKVAIEQYKAEQEAETKRRYNKRLHNVKLLLRNYRSLAMHVADIKLDIVELDKKLELTYLESDEFAIKAIKRSKERTLCMIKFINKTIQVYKIICEQSNDPKEIRKYQSIYHVHISLDEKKTIKELAECHFVDERTIKRDLSKAFEDLTALIFGIDGLKF